jgi:hypothetical protein
MSDFPSQHSVYGRALGVSYDGYPTGERGWKDRINTLTSATTSTYVNHYGVNTFDVSTGSSASGSGAGFIMNSPIAGVRTVLANITTSSTQAITITTTAGTIISGGHTVMGSSVSFGTAITAGSSYNTITLNGGGEILEMVGLSTSYYLVTSVNGFSTGDTVLSVA